MALIDAADVRETFLGCFFEEGVPVADVEARAVVVSGIMHDVGFDPAKLESAREKVVRWIRSLPIGFRSVSEGGGGGWTFLNLCMDRDDQQWMDLQQAAEQLFLLAAALGLAKIQLPRVLWTALPGGVPYMEFWTMPKP